MPETITAPMTTDEEKAAAAAATQGQTTGSGRKTRGATKKQLQKMLKKAGLKSTGSKRALTRRAKKAHLKMKGGEVLKQQGGMLTPLPLPGGQEGGKKKKGSRKSRGFKLF